MMFFIKGNKVEKCFKFHLLSIDFYRRIKRDWLKIIDSLKKGKQTKGYNVASVILKKLKCCQGIKCKNAD